MELQQQGCAVIASETICCSEAESGSPSRYNGKCAGCLHSMDKLYRQAILICVETATDAQVMLLYTAW